MITATSRIKYKLPNLEIISFLGCLPFQLHQVAPDLCTHFCSWALTVPKPFMFPYVCLHLQSHILKHPTPFCPSGKFPLIFHDSVKASPIWASFPDAQPPGRMVTPTSAFPCIFFIHLGWLCNFHIQTIFQCLTSNELRKNNYFVIFAFLAIDVLQE